MLSNSEGRDSGRLEEVGRLAQGSRGSKAPQEKVVFLGLLEPGRVLPASGFGKAGALQKTSKSLLCRPGPDSGHLVVGTGIA